MDAGEGGAAEPAKGAIDMARERIQRMEDAEAAEEGGYDGSST